MANIDTLETIYKKNIKCYRSVCIECGVDRGFQPRRNILKKCVKCSSVFKKTRTEEWKRKISSQLVGNKNGKGSRLSQADRENSQRISVEKTKNRLKLRYKNDPSFRLSRIMRARMCSIIRSLKIGKKISAIDALGCSTQELKSYLESLFKPGMTWENHGTHGWHVDHIIPLAKFNLSNMDSLRQAWHFTNLQPLWAKDNLTKGAK